MPPRPRYRRLAADDHPGQCRTLPRALCRCGRREACRAGCGVTGPTDGLSDRRRRRPIGGGRESLCRMRSTTQGTGGRLRGLPTWSPVAGSPSRMVRSAPAEARSSCPFGPTPNATDVTRPVRRLMGLPTWRPVAGSHSRMVRSSPADASSSRSSVSVPNATDDTGPVWPTRGSPTRAPVAGSHSRMVRSAPAEARSSCPFGPTPNATDVTGPVSAG